MMARRNKRISRRQDELRALYDAALEGANPNTLKAIRFTELIASRRDVHPTLRGLAEFGTLLLGLKGYGEIIQRLQRP